MLAQTYLNGKQKWEGRMLVQTWHNAAQCGTAMSVHCVPAKEEEASS